MIQAPSRPLPLALRLLPLALVALVAACGSDKAPEAEKAAAAAPQVDPAKRVAQPLTASNRVPVVAPQDYKYPGPLPKPGDMSPFQSVGVLECDQFAEKARQCLNSGALPPDKRQEAAVELRRSINTAKTKNDVDVRRNYCVDLVMKLQPKLITAGCQNL